MARMRDQNEIIVCREDNVCNKGGSIMRLFTMTMAGLVFVGITGLALANPAMLPKHPGYPSGGEFANDPGQPNLTNNQSLLEAAKSGDTNMTATVMDQNKVEQSNGRISEPRGGSQSPVVGPNANTEPSVKGTERKTK